MSDTLITGRDSNYAGEYRIICGVDEAGRGPLAGPVCAAAVILPSEFALPGINDSKKISEKRREALYAQIIEQAESYGIAFAEVQEIETMNILQATFLAMRRAVAQLAPQPELALVDGNRNPGLPCPSVCCIGGDGRFAEIAAASILAKVTRDHRLYQLDECYPDYGFAQHKGYGTRAHYAALREHGPCPAHRLSFLKNLH